MKHKNLLFIFFYLIAISSFAQQDIVPIGSIIQKKPLEWQLAQGLKEKQFVGGSANERLRLDGPQMEQATAQAIWKAVASKADIPVYKTASTSSQIVDRLTTFQEYLVYRRGGTFYEDGFMEIMEYDFYHLDFANLRNIRTTAPLRRYGFVKASDMVLWDYSIKDENGFHIKMLAIHDVTNVGKFKDDDAKKFRDSLYLYNGPDLRQKNGKAVPLLDFLFVYKIEVVNGKRVYLLGSNENMSNGPENVLLGWTDETLLKRWPGRRVFETNYSKSSFEQRQRAGYRYSLKFRGNAGDDIPFNDPGSNRWPPMRKRIVDMTPEMKDGNSNENVKVAFIWNPSMPWDKSNESDVKASEKIEGQLKNLRKINLVLLIDGSEATRLYREQVPMAFSKLKSKMDENVNNNFSYSFGAVVYRDKVVGSTPIEKIDFTDNGDDFISSLEKINYSQKDADPSNQNLLEGFLEASSMFDIQGANEQNFILIMGAGGDLRSDFPSFHSKIASNIEKHAISVLANQFTRTKQEGYSRFATQIREIMTQGLKLLSPGKEKAYKFEKTGSNTFSVDYPNSASVAAQNFNALQDIPSTPEQFQESITNAFDKIQGKLTKLISQLKQDQEGIRPPSGTGEALDRICKGCKCCGDFTSKTTVDIMIEGSIDILDPRLTEPPFVRSLLFTSNELGSFKDFLRKLGNSTGGQAEVRNQVYNSIREFVATCMGKKDISPDVERTMLNYDGAKAIERFVGYTPSDPLLQKLKSISHLKQENLVSNTDINQFVIRARRVLEYLESASFRQENDFQSSESVYSWCPVSKLL
jgi:hypothetical protein